MIINAREINGTNSVYVKTGTATISFEGIAQISNRHKIKQSYEVVGVAIGEVIPEQYAVNMADFIHCGYFCGYDRASVKIIQE